MDIPSLYALYREHPTICTDTRKIKDGCLFIGLRGPTFDGNSFAQHALELGAEYAITSDSSFTGPRIIHVDDTLVTLQLLANYHRRQMNIPVIGITGSNGKTTTKELISSVLSEKYKIHATVGNLNNHIGVPLTLLEMAPDAEILICEMGANHPGEIQSLCEIAMPTHGLLTSIGKAHLEGFGSIEGVQKAKGELFDYLHHHDGFAFVNVDDPLVEELGRGLPNKLTYGFQSSSSPTILFKYYPNKDKGGFSLQNPEGDIKIHSEMFGHYNASNMLSAYVVGKYFNVDEKIIVNILSSYIPGANRSETILLHGCKIIKDAYNANPTSMELALRDFASHYPSGWVILGDMKELGDTSLNAHEQMIDVISSLGFQKVILVGKDFKSALNSQRKKMPAYISVDQIEDLAPFWNWDNCQGETLLLKGSRSMRLEKLLEI